MCVCVCVCVRGHFVSAYHLCYEYVNSKHSRQRAVGLNMYYSVLAVSTNFIHGIWIYVCVYEEIKTGVL